MYLDSSDLEFVNDDHVGGDQIIGMRFQSVDIPQGAQIASASIVFAVDELDSGTTSLEIFGQASGDADVFVSDSFSVSDRPQTMAMVPWNPDPWTNVKDPQVSPDLTSIVQEIVSRNDWQAGNNIAVMVTGSGLRTAVSFDGDPAGAPELVITYIVPE